MSFLKRSNYSYRRLFGPFRFAVSDVKQSKKVEMNGHIYTLVGQQSIKHSPFLTNFVVYDEANQLVEQSIAQEVYSMAMISIIVEELQPLKQIFQAERYLAENSNQQADKYGVGAVPEIIYQAWDDLNHLFSTLSRKQQWTATDCANIRRYWSDFWESYKERASLLMILPKRYLTKREIKTALFDRNEVILYEAYVIAKLFIIEKLEIEMEPLDFYKWIAFIGGWALASERKTVISTKADKQSQCILVWSFYLILLGVITPFFIYRIYQAGFAYLYFLLIFYIIYFSLYYTNKYRLTQCTYVRMSDLWQMEASEENKQLFHANATSVNMGTAVLYVAIATIVMFGAYFYIHNWNWDGFALFFLILMVFTILFSIWFFYSPFVEKDITFYPRKVRAGHRVFPVGQLWKVSVDKNDIVYTFYLTYTSEPYDLHIEEEDRKEMREFTEAWCRKNEIEFTLFKKT